MGVKISELPEASSIGTSDTLVIVQGGVTKKAPLTLSPTFAGLTLADAGAISWTTDSKITRYAAKQLMISGDGTGATTNAGIVAGYLGVSGFGGIWASSIGSSFSDNNYALATTTNHTYLGVPAGGMLHMSIGGFDKLNIIAEAGSGPAITAGTATTDVNALSVTQTWNNAAVNFTGIKLDVTSTADGASSLLMDLRDDAASKFSVTKAGDVTSASSYTATGAFAFINSTVLRAPSNGILRLTDTAETNFNRINFGGDTSSFPALRRSGTTLEAVRADESAYADFAASDFRIGASPFIRATAPTIASGGCTSPAVTWNNGTAAFLITIGTSCTGVKTVTLTMPTAVNLWACSAQNNTSDAAQQTNVIAARATSATAVVLTSYDRTTGLQEDFTASDTLLVSCMGG